MIVLEIIAVVLTVYVAPPLCLYMSVRGFCREFKRFRQGRGRIDVISSYAYGLMFSVAFITCIVKYYMLRH